MAIQTVWVSGHVTKGNTTAADARITYNFTTGTSGTVSATAIPTAAITSEMFTTRAMVSEPSS